MTKEFKLPGSGLKCEDCGTQLLGVYRTVKSLSFVMRERICPKCGTKNITSERVIASRNIRTTFSDPCE